MSGSFKFGQFDISSSEVFYESELTIGLVNLKPIVPGHILIVPKRVVSRYSLLTTEEVADLTESARRITKALEKEYPDTKNGLLWLIQDGKEAGQTVPHVHLHIIPKRFSEWYQNGIEDKDRVPRTIQAMKVEAGRLKLNFL